MLRPLCLGLLSLVLPFTTAGSVSPSTLSLTNGALRLQIDLNNRCVISDAWVHDRHVSKSQSAAFTGIMISNTWFTSCSNQPDLRIKRDRDQVTISGIRFGPKTFQVEEKWVFTTPAGAAEEFKVPALRWQIERRYPAAAVIEDSVFPAWNFEKMTTWTGALLDNGGVAWNRYLDSPGATYGVKASGFVCWNPEANSALSISASQPPRERTPFFPHARFTHQHDGSQTAAFSLAPAELRPRHDLRRFHPHASDIWAPFQVTEGAVVASFKIAAFDYDNAYDLGDLRGLSERGIREMLHTIGRYGVIDRQIVGANGWRSGFKCLHEQWFSQIGIALQDPDYLRNCADTFDFERDHAFLPDGRLKSRWWWVAGDAMPGTYDNLGYYEAQWGMLMDSQTCFPICVAELFDLTGDRSWLAGQKDACERMLDYLLRRDTDGDGLVEMLNDLHTDGKGSDWIDVIWAAHENALINAELYYALERWAELEELLGDSARSASFKAFAGKLKKSFNRTTAAGGFWDPENKWYIYWRDKDGSLHGNNLVTPVNFAAIAYGLCDQTDRCDAILRRIETEMQKENLFYWPLSFFPYEPGEGHPTVNYPFPKYENGDIFLSWGELAVRAYATRQPEIALKYIKNTLKQYERDGLSFQRYERRSQAGAGDDILAGNCMPVVGLYRDLYGVHPKYNRLFLDPRLTPEIEGTRLLYHLRGQIWQIELSTSGNRIAVDDFALRSNGPFALNVTNQLLQFFPGTRAKPSLEILRSGRTPIELNIISCTENPRTSFEWSLTAGPRRAKISQRISGLEPSANYLLTSEGKARTLRADPSGKLILRHSLKQAARFSLKSQESLR